MKELSKEQLAEIEGEAEKLYPFVQADTSLANLHNIKMRAAIEAYTAAASKYLLQSIVDKERIEKLLQTGSSELSIKLMVEKDKRIKELEDGLRIKDIAVDATAKGQQTLMKALEGKYPDQEDLWDDLRTEINNDLFDDSVSSGCIEKLQSQYILIPKLNTK